MPSQGSQGRALAAEGSAESTIALKAMSVAELPTADPLTGGRAVACQFLTKQRRLLDDVDGAGLRGLRLRRNNASCTRLGSSDEANGGEQRNNDTHRVHPPWSDGTVPPRTEGYLAKALQVDESG
jgi:hypothetical protein